jgi:hypothetical protein
VNTFHISYVESINHILLFSCPVTDQHPKNMLLITVGTRNFLLIWIWPQNKQSVFLVRSGNFGLSRCQFYRIQQQFVGLLPTQVMFQGTHEKNHYREDSIEWKTQIAMVNWGFRFFFAMCWILKLMLLSGMLILRMKGVEDFSALKWEERNICLCSQSEQI